MRAIALGMTDECWHLTWGGWESSEMVRRYAHLAADHLAPFAERLSALIVPRTQIHGTVTAQSDNQVA